MLEDITAIDFRILSLFIKDYACRFSIRQITQRLDINYPHAFKRVKRLIGEKILLEKKEGQVNYISLNIQNLGAIQLVSFVEEQESQKLKNTTLRLLVKEVIRVDPLSCIGLFGSRVSGKAARGSDWDVFVISQNKKVKQIRKMMVKFPHVTNIQLQVFSVEEFQESLLSPEETVVKHIARNKRIIYNPYPFYGLICTWERVKYAPT